MEEVLKLHDDMPVENLGPDVRIFSCSIDACAKVNGPRAQAFKFIVDMQDANLSSIVVTLNLVLDACAQVSGPLRKSALLIGLPATYVISYVVTGNLVLDACATVIGQWE